MRARRDRRQEHRLLGRSTSTAEVRRGGADLVRMLKQRGLRSFEPALSDTLRRLQCLPCTSPPPDLHPGGLQPDYSAPDKPARDDCAASQNESGRHAPGHRGPEDLPVRSSGRRRSAGAAAPPPARAAGGVSPILRTARPRHVASPGGAAAPTHSRAAGRSGGAAGRSGGAAGYSCSGCRSAQRRTRTISSPRLPSPRERLHRGGE
jgi:hypothetical protein